MHVKHPSQAGRLGYSVQSVSTKPFSDFIWKAVTVLSMLGNFVYFYSPTYSFANVSASVLAPYLLFTLWRARANFPGVASTGALLVAFSLAIIIAVLNPSIQATREVRNLLTAIFFLLLAVFWVRRSPRDALQVAHIAFICFFAIAALQLSYDLFGIGIEASLEDWRVYGQSGFEIGYPAVFGNPNDFSACASAYFLLLLAAKQSRLSMGWSDSLLVLLVFLALFISGSRAAVLLCVCGLLLYSWGSRVVFSSATALASFVLLPVYYTGALTGFYSIDRFLIELYSILNAQRVGDSLFVRAQAHAYFFSNPFDFFFGSFSFDPVCPQFSRADFDSWLMMYNPHSLFLQMMCAYGAMGAILLVLLWSSIVSVLVLARARLILSLYFVSAIAVITTVPSWFLGGSQTVFFVVMALLLLTLQARDRSFA